MSLRVISSNPSVTVQDAGRVGFQRYGVSPAGPMDWLSHAAANRMMDNEPSAAAIEVGPLGCTLQAEAETRIAVASPKSTTAKTMLAGETLKLAADGFNYSYIALGGGVDGSKFMNSAAMHRRSGIGGTHVQQGSLLLANQPASTDQPVMQAPPLTVPGNIIRVIEGPQFDLFSDVDRDLLFNESWQISARSDRMGLRLQGPALAMTYGADIVSDGIVTGAVQVPGDGQPILLMADRQTTGGYPKPFVVIRADLPSAAQTPFGSHIKFKLCSIQSAHQTLHDYAKQLATLHKRAKPVLNRNFSSEELLALNLIDGAISAT